MLRLKKAIHFFEIIINQVSRLFNVIAVSVLMVMIFFVTMDVARRYFFNSPLEGSYEVVEFMMAFVFIFGVAYAQRCKRHIAVSMVVSRLSERIQVIIDSIVYFISLGFFCVIAWQAFVRARVVWLGGDISLGTIGPLGRCPYFPFYYAVACASVVLCLVFLVDFINSLVRAVEK